MRAPKITDAQKDAICTIYAAKKKNITEIAMFLGVSQRTVGRVLTEKGVLTPKQEISASANKVLTTLYKNKISPEALEQIINTPLLTFENVATFLQQCNRKQLYAVLHLAGLVDTTDPTINHIIGLSILNSPATQPIPTKAAQMSLLEPPIKE